MSQPVINHDPARILPGSQHDDRGLKRASHTPSSIPPKKSVHSGGNSLAADPNKLLPACLKKLVRSVVRTFYSREHSLIVDMLVRNTIMKEDDLCERLRFEKKQLRQYLHTLKTDQFIKYKLQLETDADGKTSKIIHYFIEYQLFVNVVKYRLDQMQRRLEAEQRQSGNRATFRCLVCNINYTDLEVDRLLSMEHPGRLECVYCRAEVTEQQEPQQQQHTADNRCRTDGRARIANFHRQVRDPIDAMLRECDAVHLSSALLEPEIRPLEPLEDEDAGVTAVTPGITGKSSKDVNLDTDRRSVDNSVVTNGGGGPSTAESRVRIVLSDHLESAQPLKPRPVWMADSTIYAGPGLVGDLSSTSTTTPVSVPSSADPQTSGTDCLTHTLTPGRIPTNFPATSSAGSRDNPADSSQTGTNSGSGGDIMQLLLVHERRGLSSTHLTAKNAQSAATRNAPKQSTPSLPAAHIGSQSVRDSAEIKSEEVGKEKFLVPIGERRVPYSDITPAEIKLMTAQERAEYVRIGKLVYQSVMLV